jgi:hypothetical protein
MDDMDLSAGLRTGLDNLITKERVFRELSSHGWISGLFEHFLAPTSKNSDRTRLVAKAVGRDKSLKSLKSQLSSMGIKVLRVAGWDWER